MSDPIRFDRRFLHPRHLGMWALVGLIYVCRWLPRRAALAIGGFIGRLFYRRNHKRREIVRINLEFCFPELNAEQREEMARRHFQCYGMNVVDLGLGWFGSSAMLRRRSRLIGEHLLDQQLARGKRIILVSPHSVGMDIGGLVLCAERGMVTMMKATPDPLLNWLIQKGRSRFDGKVIMRDEGIRSLVREIKHGRICYFIPDEDFGPESSEFVPFFATERAMLNVVGRIAKMTNAAVLPFASWLDIQSGVYNIEFGEALEDFPAGDVPADTSRVSQAIEWCVRKAPEQYMWTLRWFKTRPNGEPSPYDHLVKKSPG